MTDQDVNACICQYPFDADLLLKKQKSIKKAFRQQGNNFIKKHIAILGGSTTSFFKDQLELFLLSEGIEPVFYESEYNKYYEDGMFPNAQLGEFAPDIIIIFTSSANIINLPQIQDSESVVEQKLQSEYERYRALWSSLEEKYHAVIIQNNFDVPCNRALGNLDSSVHTGQQLFAARLNLMFAEYARTHANFCIHDINYLSAQLGLDRWYDQSQFFAYKLAMAYEVFPYIAKQASNLICAILGKTKKCLVLDLDNTLWGGVIGDDGVENIQLGHETPLAEAYTNFQQYVLKLKERGIILAVCSKNEDNIAKQGFTHPDSVLKVDDFIVFKANWQPKNLNIEEIARDLNIGLDSLVFIDDNPAERQIVRETLPMVAVPEVNPDDISSFIRVIERNGYFETVALSKDDFSRNETYKANQERMKLENSVASYDDFLKSLQMEAEINSFKEVYLDRIAQLTNKTNQFNLTTERFTRADIERMSLDKANYVTLYGRLKDKFGDNGLISVVIAEKKENALHIRLWLMSCRVLNRGMEYAMLSELVRLARKRGMTQIVGYYRPTAKNKMVENLYGEFGFQKKDESSEQTVWSLMIDKYREIPFFIGCHAGD